MPLSNGWSWPLWRPSYILNIEPVDPAESVKNMEKEKFEQAIKDSYNVTFSLIMAYQEQFGNYPDFRHKVYPNNAEPVLNTFFDTKSL